MRDRVVEVADRLNALAVPAGRRRLAEMGDDASGAYNFYKVRIERGRLISDYEIALATAIAEEPQAPRQIHEVGGGYGTFCWLMAALGFDTVCLEFDPRRLDGGQALWDAVLAGGPDMPGAVRFLKDRFPAAELEPGGACAVITNLVATTTELQRAAIIAALGRYPVAIVDVDRFLEHARTPEERDAVLDRFREAGLAAEPYLDLGASACFYGLHR